VNTLVPPLERIVERVRDHAPRRAAAGRGFEAATALVLAPDGVGLRMLVIRRATRDGDPWSGHAALPGGRRHDEDPDLAQTAIRETWEEVGVQLGAPVGQLDDVGGRVHLGVVSTFVFTLSEPVPPVPQEAEVAEALWVPVEVLIDPARSIRHPHRRLGPWPAWEHESLVIWGLTHRILSTFVDVAGIGTPAAKGP
jgi:8-oxo-dGTP pyrophosphatase MutT (NUDIX family)